MGYYLSFIIHSWPDDCDGTMHWQVRRVRDGEELVLPDAVFVVRTWVDDDECLIRARVCHVQSGREVQFQSGERLVDFIRAWIDFDAQDGLSPTAEECPITPGEPDRSSTISSC